MRTLRDILQHQDAIRAELRSINDTAAPDGPLGEEQQARWSALEAEMTALRSAEQRQATLDDLDRGAAGRPLGGGAPGKPEVRVFQGAPTSAPEAFDGTVLRAQTGERVPVLEARHKLADFVPQQASESRAQELGFGGFLRALYAGPQSELERRVLAEAAVGTGGALVPTPLSAEIIDLLRARSVAFQAGARTVPMSSQTLKFAKITEDPVGSWRAENAAITEDDGAFAATTLTAKSWALITRVSRELLEDAQNLDAVLRSSFAHAAAQALDSAILFGSGASNQPLGVANTSGIQSVSMGTNGAALSGATAWNPFLDAIALLEAANAGDGLAAIMAPRTARALYALADSTGQPLNLVPRLSGIPQFVTSGVPINLVQGSASNATTVLLGDFREVFVGVRTALTVSVLQERYADNGQVGFVAWLRADVAVARPAALAKIVGIVP